MIKPTKPGPGHEGVVEMDAMDVHEWDAGQRTPQASDANLAALVKQSASAPAALDRTGAPRPQFARTTQTSPRTPAAIGTPGIQPPPGAARPAPPRSRRQVADEREDTAPSAPPPASTFDTAPQPHVVFDDPAERTRPAGTLVPPQGTPLPVQARSVAAAATALRSAPSLPQGTAPMPSPSPSYRAQPAVAGAARIQSPFPSAHEAAPLRYPLAVLEPTAPPRPELERRASSAPEPRVAPSRRTLWWIGGAIGAATIGIVLAVMSSGGSDDAPAAQVAERAPVAAVAPRPAAVAPVQPPAPAPPHPTAAAPPAPAATHSAPPAPAPAPVPAPAPALVPAPVRERPTPSTRTAAGASRPTRVAVATQRPSRPARRPAKKPSKKLVVAYSDHPSAVETPGLVAQATEDPAISRARGAYIAGNEKLFAGDTAGAIEAYRESLGMYPGYVGGYRGLGLAYAQRGDNAQALEAFKTYIAAAPAARDVPLIKKRITRLQHSSARLPL